MKRHLPIILILACAAGFAFGVIQLFKLRFEVGDVYPEYSSLRSDPLGTMAIYESLEKMPGVAVRRDFSTANRLPDGKQTVYLHLAASSYQWRWMPEETFKEIERFVDDGGRLAITMFPEASSGPWPRGWNDEPETNSPFARVKAPKDGKPNSEPKSDPAKPKKKKPKHPDEDELGDKYTSLTDRWGVGFEIVSLDQGDEGIYEPALVRNTSDLPLPESLDWHSGIVCTNLSKAWETIYTRGTSAVVIERKFGRGSVVIATDSYFLSNEALAGDRHADLLAWLVGSSRNVVFDEAHLGVTENPGVATLMRKYRLYWLVAGLVLLAGLFIWKNSFSLAPPHREERRQEYVAGKDAAAGFVNLLRRSIAPRDLLATCFAEWKKSTVPGGKYSAARLQEAEAAFQVENSLQPKDRNPLRTYGQIHQILKIRKPEHATRNTQQE